MNFWTLKNHNIPLIIISADGCGEAIPMMLEKIGKNYPNIFYVINRIEWDSEGKAIGVKKPIIHSLNKDETVLRYFPEIYEVVRNRKNIILLGDSINDVNMVKGFKYKNLLKIGFLNFDEDKLRDSYSKNFDVIIEGDGDFSFINELIRGMN